MSAFSEQNPNLQLVWDASSLKSFQFCPRHYQLANLQGWQNPSVDLAFGRLIASGFERYQKARLDGRTREEAIIVAIKWAMEETYYAAPVHEHASEEGVEQWAEVEDGQWGGHYETQWKCEGTTKYTNAKGNRAKCPFAFEKAWFPGEAPDICGECGSGIRVERRYVPDDDKKNRQTLIRALIWYGLDQPEDIEESLHPYVFPSGQPAVELSGKLPLPYEAYTGESFALAYNLDYLGQFGSELFIVDNKTTTKSLNDMYFGQYSPDTQFDTYAMVATIAFPNLPIRGTMVDAVQVMIGGVEFGRHPYYKVEEQHSEHWNDLEWWIKSADYYAQRNYWPMNKRSCWLCPFKRACSLAPSDREVYLKSNFTQQPRWDPTHER